MEDFAKFVFVFVLVFVFVNCMMMIEMGARLEEIWTRVAVPGEKVQQLKSSFRGDNYLDQSEARIQFSRPMRRLLIQRPGTTLHPTQFAPADHY